MNELQVGDLVESLPGHALACGSGIYPHAVVVSLDPFALVSVEGDMLWTATQRPDTVRRLGPAPDTKAAFARWEQERTNHNQSARDWLHARNVIAKAIREMVPSMLPSWADNNAAAIIARLAQADPPLILCRPEEIKDR